MIGKLAFNNLKKTYKIYFIYIFTLTLTIALFYGFNALDATPAVTTLAKENAKYTQVFLNLIKITSYFISFFVVFLMVYASNFFFKVRAKEYFIYKTLGMSKKELIKLIFLENMIIGTISCGFGIIIGIFINQLLSQVLMSYIDLDSSIQLIISGSAIMKTIVYFVLILLIISIISAIKINRKTIIELRNFKSTIVKKVQKPIISWILILIGLIILGFSYFLAYISELNPGNPAFILAIIGGFIGTTSCYFGMINFQNYRFKKQSNQKNRFRRALFNNRLMKNKMAISLISVAFVFILTSIFGGNALINIFDLDGNTLPFDAQITSYDPETYNLSEFNFDKYDLDKDQTVVYSTVSYIKDRYYFPIIKQSQFQQLTKLKGISGIETADYQFYQGNDINVYDESGNNTGKTVNNVDILKDIKTPEAIEVTNNDDIQKLFTFGVLVVNDNKYEQLIEDNVEIDTGFAIEDMAIKYKNPNDEKKLEQITEDYKINEVNIMTNQQILKTSLVFKISILFITMYIAFFLVIICLAILAIQQIMDAVDNQDEYKKVKLLGMSKKEVRKIVRKNTNVYFIYPLFLAIISSLFALVSVDHFVKITTGNHLISMQQNQNITIIIIILVIIYIVYIELVKNLYFKVIGE